MQTATSARQHLEAGQFDDMARAYATLRATMGTLHTKQFEGGTKQAAGLAHPGRTQSTRMRSARSCLGRRRHAPAFTIALAPWRRQS